MPYLIAKKFSEKGCLAVQTEGGKALANLVSYLGLMTLSKGIEILTISDPETYGEYAPFHFVSSEKEFISRVLDMFSKENSIIDERLDNCLHFLCTIIEYTARRTNNHRGDIVKQIGLDGLKRELYNAEVNCALSYEQVSDENIEDYHITDGDFDTISNLKHRIPSVAMIGRVYANLIESLCPDNSDESKLIQTMNEVFCSWISDAISDFDSVVYYSNTDYLRDSYNAGYLLNS